MSFRPDRFQVSAWLAGAALILLFFWKLAFTNLIFARGDMFLYFYPYWDYRAQALLAGRLPLWNPYLFMGAPFLANSQAGVLYPLNWPLAFFPAPVAIKISILVHLVIAFVGAQTFARRALGQSGLAAWLAATLFALGGYLTTQVEHINQLQGLAWFPWLLMTKRIRDWRLRSAPVGLETVTRPFGVVAGAVVLSFQILAGHTQSVFISLTGLILYWLITKGEFPLKANLKLLILQFLIPFLLPAAFLAFLLSAAQLLPTLELSRESLRSGGLSWRDALSFSLDPRLLGRALLPGYSRSLFTEFVAYVGVVGLALAALGTGRERLRLAMLVLALVGFACALGVFNPVYALLALGPPFNLFRVPARWLFLFAFGLAMLAGYGLDQVREGKRLENWRPWPLTRSGIGLTVGLALPAVLSLLTLLAVNFTPAGETGPLGAPAWRDWLGWLGPLGLLIVLFVSPIPARWRAPALVGLAIAELFAASWVLPFSRLTAPEAYTSIRPAMTQLLVTTHQSPPPRFLSMSALHFDPGDLAELHGIWDPQLPQAAVDDLIVATKHKEVLSPNLPLAWNIPAVDGFDGGILPLKHYAEFTQLFTGSLSADGRLRENLSKDPQTNALTPDPRLLSLVNARYLITDKVNDAWVEGVFYDLQFTLTLTEGETSEIAYLPSFQATALGLVMDSPTGHVQVEFADGSAAEFPITNNRLHFDHPSTPSRLTLFGPLSLRGASLIDERTGAFQSLALGPYRLVHSGDVKIYENLEVLPRAFVAPQGQVKAEEAEARSRLADPGLDPKWEVVLASPPTNILAYGLGSRPDVNFEVYSPEYVRLTAQGPGYLVLTDAFYPGWVATVDGQPAPILRADLMFRAIFLGFGAHSVEFGFEPRSVTIGLWVSGIAWGAVLVGMGVLYYREAR